MYSLRRWLYKPRRDDTSILAQFFYADEDLNYVAAELDSFDGRKDPERCTHLVNQLRQCQDRVLNICNQIMEETIPEHRANRDFRVKFPDDVLQENLAGQLWFGAECLAAGSSIMNREVESASMRPLAKALTKTLDNVRNLLREQCLRNPNCYNEKIKEALRIFDRYFAEFELSYVSAMVPVKTMREYDIQQEVIVLFSETLQRALQIGLITQDMVDDYDPALMFTIPRIAIICGLLVFPDGPLNVDLNPNDMSEMFRPFQNLLHKIRDLLWSLTSSELFALEKALCSLEEPGMFQNTTEQTVQESYLLPDVDDYVQKVCTDYPSCKQFISDYCERNFLPVPADELGEGEPQFWIQDCDSGEELVALQESLSNALTKVIERSGTRDSGLHSDTCSNSSENSHNAESAACHSGVTKTDSLHEDTSQMCDEISLSSYEDLEISNIMSGIVDELIISATKLSEPRQHLHDNLETSTPTSSKIQVDHCGANLTQCYSQNNSVVNNVSPNHRCIKSHHRDYYKLSHSYPNSPCNCVEVSVQLKSFCSGNAIYSSCSSCQSAASSSEWDSDCCSSETSSYNSECQDDEEIALAIQAAEIATRNKARGRFRSSEDLIHRLFVCIAGVADQLQTNHASDLRNILKYVFQMNCSEPLIPPSPQPEENHSQLINNILLDEEQHSNIDRINVENAEEAIENICHSPTSEEPPPWIPDELAPDCMSCHAPFTVVRRRHHCRNCGKVFCSKCSSNSVPLPRYGHSKPVRVCNRCFIFQVTPFLIDDEA